MRLPYNTSFHDWLFLNGFLNDGPKKVARFFKLVYKGYGYDSKLLSTFVNIADYDLRVQNEIAHLVCLMEGGQWNTTTCQCSVDLSTTNNSSQKYRSVISSVLNHIPRQFIDSPITSNAPVSSSLEWFIISGIIVVLTVVGIIIICWLCKSKRNGYQQLQT